jgi:hypothetical protein
MPMATKKIISLGLLLMGLLSFPAFGAKVTMQPLYTDARFQPINAFHAGCDQDAQFNFDGKEKNITDIHLVVNYNPDEIQISHVIGTDNVPLDYKMEDSSIIFDYANVDKTTQIFPLFHIAFQSDPGITSSDISIATGSYFVANGKKTPLTQTIPLTFATVLECTPDVIPPSIKLVYPSDPKAKITLDQYFIFDIKDIGKGVDKNSVQIILDGQVYTPATENLKRNGNYLTFYPKDRLAIDTGISLTISADDLQSYG